MERATRGRPATLAMATMAGLIGVVAFAGSFALAVVVFFVSPFASYVLVGALIVVGVVAFALTDNPVVVALASGTALAGILAVFLLFFLAADAGSDVENTTPSPRPLVTVRA